MTWISYIFDAKYNGPVPIVFVCGKCGIVYDTRQIGVDYDSIHFYDWMQNKQ